MFLNKQKHINTKEWHSNGRLKKIIYNNKSVKEYYNNGVLQYELDSLGNSKSYFSNGKLESERDIKGNVKYYDIEGRLVNEELDGKRIFYYDNGKVKSEDFMGFVNEYYQNGNKKYISNHVHIYMDDTGNKLNGNIKHYYYSDSDKPAQFGPGCIPSKDILVSDRSYKDGLLHGIQKEWSDFGDYLERVEEYSFGIKHGIHKIYNGNGLIVDVTCYRNGEMYGLSKSWHDNGQIESECFYGDDMYPHREWYDNGQMSYEKIGAIIKEWDENGKIIKNQ